MKEQLWNWLNKFFIKSNDLPMLNDLSTKSENPKIRTVNKLILDSEKVDSDYWDSWGNYLLEDELVQFSSEDWLELLSDIKNWNSQQLWILAEMLVSERTSKLTDFDATAVYGYIFTVADNETADDLIDNLLELDNGVEKPKELLLSIMARIQELRNSSKRIQPDILYSSRFEFVEGLLKRTAGNNT